MTPELRETLIRRFLDVSSEFAFLMLEVAEPDRNGETDGYQSVIRFSGDREGSFTLGMEKSIAIEMAANLLSVDEDSEAARNQAPDSVNELLNIIAGHLVTDVYGEEPDINLSSPSCEAVPYLSASDGEHTLMFLESDRPVVLFLNLGEGFQDEGKADSG